MSEKNVFEKIIDGDISCEKVYEDDNFLAFLDPYPVAIGHTLVIPKEKGHVWIQETPDELVRDFFSAAKNLMTPIKNAFDADYVQLSVSGTDVPHIHIHLIPRFFDDEIPSRPTISYENHTHMEETAYIIKKNI